MSLPNTFLVGAVRGGTTSLYEYLAQHPQVFVPSVKEPHHFANLPRSGLATTAWRRLARQHPRGSRAMPAYRVGARKYRRLYRAASAPIRLDASTSYLMDPDAPRRIHEAVPEAKILVTLRDPVERAYSHYLLDRSRQRQRLDFHEALLTDRDYPDRRWGRAPLYWEQGEYAKGLARYLDLFGDRVLVLTFSELTRQTEATLHKVCDFLGIDKAALAQVDAGKAHNAYREPAGRLGRLVAGSGVAKSFGRLLPTSLRNQVLKRISKPNAAKPPMEPAARALLEAHYAPLMRELEGLIGPRPELWPWGQAQRQAQGGSPAMDASRARSAR